MRKCDIMLWYEMDSVICWDWGIFSSSNKGFSVKTADDSKQVVWEIVIVFGEFEQTKREKTKIHSCQQINKVANSGDASDNSILQRFLNRISSWFRSFSHCMGNCFGTNTTDDDQLLRDGPSQSNSAEQFPHRVSTPTKILFLKLF